MQKIIDFLSRFLPFLKKKPEIEKLLDDVITHINGEPVDYVENGNAIIIARHPISDKYLECVVKRSPIGEGVYTLLFAEGDGWLIAEEGIERSSKTSEQLEAEEKDVAEEQQKTSSIILLS